jgi:hypothetical protein
VHAYSSGNIPLKAGYTNTHVSRIPPLLEQGSQDPDYSADANNPPPGGQEILHTSSAFASFTVAGC